MNFLNIKLLLEAYSPPPRQMQLLILEHVPPAVAKEAVVTIEHKSTVFNT